MEFTSRLSTEGIVKSDLKFATYRCFDQVLSQILKKE